MEKEFKSITEQLKLLKSRNIIINNYKAAYKILEENNYYYLINGYKDPFINNNNENEQFIPGTRLDEIYSLYEFDRKLRITFLEYILLIERKIKTYIAYEFSKEHGHKNYLIPENFNYINKNQKNINTFLNNINLEISHQYKNSNKMIVHYLNVHKYIPLWVLIRTLSFGKMSKFYSFMKQKEQNNISRKFNITNQSLKIYLINLGNIRNICAHDEKLYDIKLKNRIPITEYHKKLNINHQNKNYHLATRDIFSIITILKIMLEAQYFNKFYLQIIKDIEILEKQISTISINKILYKMGFPSNYQNLLTL